MTLDFVIESRVGRASREICDFSFDHFLISESFDPENCSSWIKIGTHTVDVID